MTRAHWIQLADMLAILWFIVYFWALGRFNEPTDDWDKIDSAI